MMKLLTVAVASTMSVGIAMSADPPEPVITEYGRVEGVIERDLTVYRGIPFAAPPVGDLRWRPPQPAVKWDGIRQATRFAPDPWQGDGSGNVSEDCLSNGFRGTSRHSAVIRTW
jgi:para-nitrobenzyl esterase